MKKKWWRLAAVNILLMLLFVGAYCTEYDIATENLGIEVVYAETHANLNGGTSQLFFAGEGEDFSQEKSLLCNIQGDGTYVDFQLPRLDFVNTGFRLDPFMNTEEFSFDSIRIIYKGKLLCTLWQGELPNYIADCQNCKYVYNESYFQVENDDPIIFLNSSFNERIMNEWHAELNEKGELVAVVILLLVWIEAAIFLLEKYGTKSRIPMRKKHFVSLVFASVLLSLGMMLGYGAEYLVKHFGDVGIQELLFYMKTPLVGTNMSSFEVMFKTCACIIGVSVVVVAVADMMARRVGWKKGYVLWIILPGIVVGGYAVGMTAKHFDVVSYWKFIHDDTTLYEDYYVDAREVELTFPEEKRNLVYIFLESMEVTYASQSVGGAMKENYIPELSKLALENIDFSEDGKMQGVITLTGADYTSGGLVTQTSAVLLNPSLMTGASVNKGLYSHEPMLPGAWTIGDVLQEEGYQQVFMVGSAGAFGGRSTYMQAHGNYEIWDYYTAIDEGKIGADYYVWWGYEDEKLISYAKEELLALSKENKPFNFTMLTADTHFTDGYLCEQCGDAYEDQYSNVIACSSRMIGEFVEWIKQQEFYENTTIVIVGDHPTMDSAYIEKM